MQLEAKLKSVFGYDQFRFDQKEIIQRCLDGKDSLVIMPTGGGKSLCYQMPALVLDGITIVISPLIALMKDQVNELNQVGVPAAYLNSSLTQGGQHQVVTNLMYGKNRILFISPERLFANEAYFLKFLKKQKVSLIALDEAHCISQWGHDFRSDYLKVSRLKGFFPNVPIIALTATADKKTRASILDILNLETPKVYISSFNRENIKYSIKPKQNTKNELLKLLEVYKSSTGIVYTLSRKSSDSIASFLKMKGFKAKAYHAGMTSSERLKVQEDFTHDRINIVVATIAFGMGINKSNVRFVIHMDLPKNIESYYQETGRAGRDGLPSEAILFFSRGDAMLLKRFILTEDDAFNEVLLTKLNQMTMFCESFSCRRKYLLNYFEEEFEAPCNNCDNCLSDHEHLDGTIIAQKVISAVVRLSGNFGISYVIDFLRGSKSKKIKLYHMELKTYGVGKDLSKAEWQSYIHQLVDQQILYISEGKYPLLKQGRKATLVLAGNLKVSLIKVIRPSKSKAKKITFSGEYDQILFDKLRSLRTEYARKESVPPYVIFSDKTIADICQKRPTSTSAMHAVHGFGEVKVRKYGEAVLSVLNEYQNTV